MADRDGVSVVQLEPAPGRFGQGGLVMSDQIVRDLIQCGDDMAFSGSQQKPIVRDKSLRPADCALLVHEDDGFVLRIDAQATYAQPVPVGRLHNRPKFAHARSTCWP